MNAEIALPMVYIVKRGTLTDKEIAQLLINNPGVEVVSEEEYVRRVDEANREAFAPYLNELKSLSFSGKLDWYAKRNSQEVVYLGHNPYFQRYWRHHVLWPIKFKRFFYRLKNGQLWQKHQHISEIRGAGKKAALGPQRI